MPADEEEKVEPKTKATAEETDEEHSDAETEDEDEVEGHVSVVDQWLPSNQNKWKRRK